MARIRRVDSERELETLVDQFMTKGYKVSNRGQHSAKVKEKDWGSAPVHVFVFIFAFVTAALIFSAAEVSADGVIVVAILANVLYCTYSWFTSEEVLIKVDRDDGGSGGGRSRDVGEDVFERPVDGDEQPPVDPADNE